MHRFIMSTVIASLVSTAPSAAQSHGQKAEDSAFAALQHRGHAVMGVDQYTSAHRFEPLADGGRIELQREVGDSLGVRQIRRHLRGIAEAFKLGDFQAPGSVHQKKVPGTEVMNRKRERISYTFRELPLGGEVRLSSRDPEAVQAIHEFLAFQRREHRVDP